MSELALRDASAVALQPDHIIQRSGGVFERDVIDGWVQVLDDVSRLANFIAETDFVPRALRNRPAAVAACILTGRELGIGPMQSLKSIHMVQGVPSLSAEYKRARALAAGHEIVFDDTNSTRCVIRGRRSGTERWVTIQWTLDMARRAKLAGKDVWQQYPQRMLQARASSELCDLLFPDASLGLATMEVLEDGGIVTESGETVDAATGELTASATPAIEAPKPRTAQRKPRAQSSPPAPVAPPPGPGAAPLSAERASGDLPPLPGEEDAPGPEQAPPAGTEPAAGPGAPDETDYDTPGTAPANMITAIWTVLSTNYRFTKNEKDQARAVCAHVISHDLASTTNLSRNEAKTILDTLGHWQYQAEREQKSPRDYMTALMASQDADPRDEDEEARSGE